MNTVKKLTLTSSLDELLESSANLKTNLQNLQSTTPQSTPAAELSQFTDKPAAPHHGSSTSPQPSEEPVHKTMQAYTDTLHNTQRESNLTTTMLQDIPTFDHQDSSKREDWFMDIKLPLTS